MNRRSFFKTIAGVLAGLFGVSVPGKAKTVAPNKDNCIYYAPIDGVCKCKNKGMIWYCTGGNCWPREPISVFWLGNIPMSDGRISKFPKSRIPSKMKTVIKGLSENNANLTDMI